MKRLFIAINLPESLKEKLELEKEKELGNAVKWVEKHNLHLTLAFLGSVKDEEIPFIIEKMEKAEKGSFSLKLKKITYDRIPPRLIWIELEKNERLDKLAKSLNQKPFFGHITLGRVKTWAWKRIEPEERPQIAKELNFEFQVKSIELMESILKKQGPEYHILQSIKL